MSAHILIIDDDLSTLEMLDLALEAEGGYRVTTSEAIFQDLAEVERLHPDLILLDFKFGGRELGWNFLQQLKLRRATAFIPVILCTAALNDVQEQEPVLLQKGVPILYKPFSLDKLLALIQQRLASPSS